MRHRIFIAINLPKEIKEKLESFQEKWPELPVRWTKKENLHITLIFSGSLSDEELLRIINTTKEIAQRNNSFVVNLNKISYGPPKKMPPRMVWAIGERSPEFTSLRDDLEKSLMSSEGVRFSSEKRAFSPHITLGRMRVWEFQRIEPEERPEVDEEINLNFQVESIEVMESRLKRNGAEYTILETIPLVAS